MLAIGPGLLPNGSRSRLDETGNAPLLERNVDDIEVPRDDRLREDRARLTDDLRTEVAIGEVREREHAHLGRLRDRGGARRRRVERLVRALALLLGERRLVHEQVRVLRDLEDGRRRCRVAGEHDPPARPWRAEHLLGPHLGPAGKLHGLPCLEATEQGPLRDSQRAGGLDVEPSRPGQLDERVPVRGDAVRDPEDEHPIVAAVERVTVPELDELDVIGQLAEDALEAAEELLAGPAARRR